MVHVRHLDPVLETWDAVWLSRRYVKDVKDALCSFCRCPLDGCIYRRKTERALVHLGYFIFRVFPRVDLSIISVILCSILSGLIYHKIGS